MRLLDRYLLRELLLPLGVCLGGFLIFWIAFDLFSDLARFQENQMRAGDVVEYYLARLPEFVVLILPIALLLALLHTLTNHARHNEITAIRAAGVSLGRICLPYLAVGLLFGVVLFVCNEFWVPDCADRAEQIKDRRTGKKGGGNALVFNDVRGSRLWNFNAYDPDAHAMSEPTVDWGLPDGSRRRIIARRAAWTAAGWTFYDVTETTTPAAGLIPTPLVTNALALPELPETPEQINREIRFKRLLTLTGPRLPEIPVLEILDYLRLHPDETAQNRSQLHTQLQERLALPWTCLVVVVIAIPFGAASGRRNVFVGVAGSIAICFCFFVVQKFALAMGMGGRMPAWLAAWAPNLSFGAVGLWLMSRVR